MRADSSLFRLTLSSRRASAGTKSPASKWMMSPGTSSEASMTCSFPSRRTRAWGADRFFRASRAFSALLSWSMPMTALRTTMSRISTGSKNSEVSPVVQAIPKETAAAMSRMMIITSLNWAKNRCRLVFFFCSASLFAPYRAFACSACFWVRPAFGSVPYVWSSASVGEWWAVIEVLLSDGFLLKMRENQGRILSLALLREVCYIII